MMHERIQKEHTGTPMEFAKAMQISRAQLYILLNILKDYGASVKYDRIRHTFYYCDDFILREFNP